MLPILEISPQPGRLNALTVSSVCEQLEALLSLSGRLVSAAPACQLELVQSTTQRPELQRFDRRASAYTFRSEPASSPFC